MTICRFIFILLSIYACHARSPHKRSIIDPDFKVTMASLASVSSTAPQMTTHKLSSRYLQSTSRKITLDDGRVVKCQVPLLDDSSFDQQLLNDTDIVPETRKLTTEEAEPFLMYLKDECTYHRTNDFLWEFCHNKYIRQFDDEITIHNARKPAPELFFLGFHSSVDPQKYIRAIRPEMGPYPPEIDYDLPLRGEVPLERYLHTHGHIAKIVNIRSFHRHNPDTLYFIRAYVPAKELNDSAIVDVNGKTLKYYKKAKKESRITKIIDGNKYIKLERFLVRVLNSDTALLENEFPMDISTKHTKIFPYTGKIDKRSWLNRTVVETITQEMLLFKNYVYGRKAFLSTADAYSSVLLINNKSQVFSKTIVEVIDDSILRIAEDLEKSDIQPHTLILIENNGLYKNLKFTQGNGKIWAMGNVVLGKGTSFKKDFERGDLIMLLKGVNSTWTEHSFEVLKVIHDTLLIVRNPITASKIKSSTSLYMIGKPFDLEKYAQQFSENRTLYKDNSVNSINTETLNNLLLIRTGKKIEEDEPFCHPSFYFPDSRSWLMTFEPRLFNRNANLMLHFSNTACNTEEGIEVNFNHMEELIITDPHDRMRPLRAPLIRNPKTKIKAYRAIVWMIFNQGTLTIGQGDPISLENQILSMKLSNEIELSHYTINKQFSYNLELANIQVQTLPSTLQDTFDLMRNFTAIRGNATYIESYGQGTYCGASKFERRTDVEYKCSKNDAFFEIEKVEEDATCHYHLVVGTNLLCPDKRRDQNIAQKTFNINCIVEDV